MIDLSAMHPFVIPAALLVAMVLYGVIEWRFGW